MKANLALKTVIFIVILSSYIQTALSQENEGAALRVQESEREISVEEAKQLRATEKVTDEDKDFTFDFGVWVYGSYRHYRNIDNDNDVEDWIKDTFVLDTRAWARATYLRLLTLYCRFMNAYTWRPNVSSDYTGVGDDFEGPVVDVLYADVNLKEKYDVPFSTRIGRQYISAGRGITYGDVHDAALFKYGFGEKVKIKAFISKTKPYDDNIDYSVPGYKDECDRNFYGAEAAFFFPKGVLYGYGLIQRDRSHEYPEDLTQNYTYDSEYLGAGFDIRHKGLTCWGEIIKEFGRSYTDATKTELARKDIDAWALDTGAKYKFDCYSHPVLGVEFMYGSGDKDRTRVTNTSGGNVNGRDHNFLYFGTINAGYAMAPRISNMIIYKAGIGFKPLEFIPYVGKRLAVGSKYYLYRKDKKSGGIYDVDATEASADVGQEIDFFINWNVYENMNIIARFGKFFPGAAYPDGVRDPSEYLYIRTRVTF